MVVPVRVHQGLLDSARKSVTIDPTRVSGSSCCSFLRFWFVLVAVLVPTRDRFQ